MTFVLADVARMFGPPPNCVCGHPSAAHRPCVMSVPLRGRGRYPATGATNGVTRTHPDATYVREECGCGCTCFLPDLGT